MQNENKVKIKLPSWEKQEEIVKNIESLEQNVIEAEKNLAKTKLEDY